MAWRFHGRAVVNPNHPVSFAICDRCGFQFNIDRLGWQFEWAGPQLQNLRLLVCPSCMDKPQPQLQPRILPPDPMPTLNARPPDYEYMDIDDRVTEDDDERITEDGDERVVENVANEREEAP